VRASGPCATTISRAGECPLMNRVGHAFIKQRIGEDDASRRVRYRSHYYFRDF